MTDALGVEVVACLPSDLLERLCKAVQDVATVHVASPPNLRSLLALHRDAVVVVDPEGVRDVKDMSRLCVALEAHPISAVVAYARLTEQAFQAFGQLSRLGVTHLIIHDHDDQPGRLRETLVRTGSDVTTAFLRAVTPPLMSLPSGVRSAVEGLFLAPASIQDIDQLADAAGVSRRGLHNVLARAGVAPSGKLLRFARVLYAYHHLRQDHSSLTTVSETLGYCNPRALQREFRQVMGRPPSAIVGGTLLPAEVLTRLVGRFQLRPAAQHEQVFEGSG